MQNAQIFGEEWELTVEEMGELDDLDEGEGEEARGAVVQAVVN